MFEYLDKRFGFSETTKVWLLVLTLIIFVVISFYLFLTYIYEFFIFQAYCYGLMKSDSPVKAAWYTIFILAAYLILKFIFIRFGVLI